MDMLAELRAIVGENNVLTEDADTAGYLVDWSNRFFGKTPAVVRPGNTEEVAQVLAWANRTARCGASVGQHESGGRRNPFAKGRRDFVVAFTHEQN